VIAPRVSQLRVLPAGRGLWRVEDGGSLRTQCATLSEAEALAEQLLQDVGGGEMLVYDAYRRLRTVKRLPPGLPQPQRQRGR
jgi:hypothetical protein